jgi:hypothetical protein
MLIGLLLYFIFSFASSPFPTFLYIFFVPLFISRSIATSNSTPHELPSLPLLPSLTLPNESSTFPKLEILNGEKLALQKLTPCEDNSENDDQLVEELMGYVSPTPIEGNSNHIPLLTPPLLNLMKI